jgi:hypothetical protein
MSDNIYTLCHYNGNIVPEVSSSITYNNEISLLLTGNLGMLYAELKETICYGLGGIIMILMLK